MRRPLLTSQLLTSPLLTSQRAVLRMDSSDNYVLVLEQNSDDLHVLESMLHRLRCPIVVTDSADHAVARASQLPPYLIILSGSQKSWAEQLLQKFRRITDTYDVTILALTESHAPHWQRQEDNPGFDGFLVKPLHGDVLMTLMQSAWLRRSYCSES